MAPTCRGEEVSSLPNINAAKHNIKQLSAYATFGNFAVLLFLRISFSLQQCKFIKSRQLGHMPKMEVHACYMYSKSEVTAASEYTKQTTFAPSTSTNTAEKKHYQLVRHTFNIWIPKNTHIKQILWNVRWLTVLVDEHSDADAVKIDTIEKVFDVYSIFWGRFWHLQHSLGHFLHHWGMTIAHSVKHWCKSANAREARVLDFCLEMPGYLYLEVPDGSYKLGHLRDIKCTVMIWWSRVWI